MRQCDFEVFLKVFSAFLDPMSQIVRFCYDPFPTMSHMVRFCYHPPPLTLYQFLMKKLLFVNIFDLFLYFIKLNVKYQAIQIHKQFATFVSNF